MPYITEYRRDIVEDSNEPLSAGELNYLITNLLLTYEQVQGKSYQTYNDMVGALEGAKLELYRRRVAPYEDTKIATNGDVY